MKRIKLFTTLLALFAVAAICFTGCKNFFGGNHDAKKDNKPSYIKLSLESVSKDAKKDARSALPDSKNITFVKFELIGVPKTEGSAEVRWATNDDSEDAKSELVRAQVTVIKGATYEFTLSATTIGGDVYTDTVEKTIESGENTLKFKLTLVKLGTDGSGTKGKAQIGVNLPKDEEGKSKVSRVTVSVYPLDENGDTGEDPVSEALTDKEVPIKDGVANFDSGSLDPGLYYAVFTLFGGEDGQTYIDQWHEFIGISGGEVSKSVLNEEDEREVDEPVSLGDGEFILDFELTTNGAAQGTAQ